MSLYHHNRPFEYVRYGLITPYRITDEPAPCTDKCDVCDDWHTALHFEAAYQWLAEQVGYWPLFLSVGRSDDDKRMTGYQSQFRKPSPTTEVPDNDVLFSWEESPSNLLRYTCYDHWHIPLNMIYYEDKHTAEVYGMTERMSAWVFHPSWRPSNWLREARKNPHTVQAVAPQLDLRNATEISCRNKTTKKKLVSMGFNENKIVVKHLKVELDLY